MQTNSASKSRLATCPIFLREIQEIKCPTVLQIFRLKPRYTGVRPKGDTDGGEAAHRARGFPPKFGGRTSSPQLLSTRCC
ncbi:MAG: hypothetical protein AAFV71_13125 [Cyanobacteria bacterium J06633_8]